MDLENFAIEKMKWVLVQLVTINFIVLGPVRINKIVKLDTLIKNRITFRNMLLNLLLL